MIDRLKKTNQKINNKGFTLIELLIVIAIIGVLASLLIVNFIGVRQRARDAQRKSDIRQIQSALEMYRADVGAYPTTEEFTNNSCIGSLNGELECDDQSATIYIREIPVDPSGEINDYNEGEYCLDSNGTTYYLVTCLENGEDSQGVNSIEDANCPSNCSTGTYYLVKNP